MLDFSVKDGWGPLCRFLGREDEVPDRPFPHVNEGDFITRFHFIIFWVRVIAVVRNWVVWGIVPTILAGAISWLWFRTALVGD